ncbi:hypothetical protein B0H19DRAFT_1086485 [Mycena capillaripes]|nr:hypothetical protein B0H19DRAFT_1086485 [Mycena capillaripes]
MASVGPTPVKCHEAAVMALAGCVTAVGASGQYMLLLVHEGNNGLEGTSLNQYGYLALLHFNSTPAPHFTFRKLDVGAVTLSFCYRIALDDSLGLVLVVDMMGTGTIYSFV